MSGPAPHLHSVRELGCSSRPKPYPALSTLGSIQPRNPHARSFSIGSWVAGTMPLSAPAEGAARMGTVCRPRQIPCGPLAAATFPSATCHRGWQNLKALLGPLHDRRRTQLTSSCLTQGCQGSSERILWAPQTPWLGEVTMGSVSSVTQEVSLRNVSPGDLAIGGLRDVCE